MFLACNSSNINRWIIAPRVSSKSDQNRMPPHNLSVVFGPTVIHAPATAELITNQGQINIFIEFLITEFFSIFPNEKRLNNDGTRSTQSEDENEEAGYEDGDVSDISDGNYQCYLCFVNFNVYYMHLVYNE